MFWRLILTYKDSGPIPVVKTCENCLKQKHASVMNYLKKSMPQKWECWEMLGAPGGLWDFEEAIRGCRLEESKSRLAAGKL